jgi:hypothetical protein
MSEWTRLSDELPPGDGRPFEFRRDGDPNRYFASVSRDRVYLLLAGDVSCTFNIPWPITRTVGWWRLLPDDEPPAEGRA